MSKRLVGVFTGNRAEYGLQVPLLRAIEKHPTLGYCLFVSGAHLEKNFGSTLMEIEEDGFHIDAEIKIDFEDKNETSVSRAIGSGVISICLALEKHRPDMLVVYADRFEGFSAVIAASQMGIPVFHIEGGDLTEGGALDDSVRHAMTKLSHVHFTTNQQAFNRVLALGEESWRVHNVGYPANDVIATGDYAAKEEVVERYNLDLKRPIVIFTQHSVTTEFEKSVDQIRPSLSAMKRLASENVQIFITYPNNDLGGRDIVKQITNFAKERLDNINIYQSLGRYQYHGFLALSRDRLVQIACVGNSSSGIKETPIFGCPTVNIGTRQKGRLRGTNVIDSGYDEEGIYQAVNKCFYDVSHRNECFTTDNPYYLGNAGETMAKVLATVRLDQKLIQKLMTIRGEAMNGWFR